MLSTLNANDKLKLMGAIKDMSTSLTRMDAERDLQKNIKNDICKELDLNKKVFTKLAKTYHKQNFSEEVALHEEYETLYENVTKSSV
jgi:hypothetical protein